MTTNVKSSQGSKTATRKSVKNGALAAGVGSAVAAASAAVSAGSATSHDVAVSLAAGAASVASVPAGRASAVASAVMDEKEVKLMELRARIASNWAAPEWSGAAALRAQLVAIGGLSDEQINAAVAAAGRKSGEDLNAVTPSIEEVTDYIRNNFAKEFKTLCGCAVPAAGAVRCYSYSNLSVSTINADSDINDYLISAAVPAGLSASSLVAAVMSVRVLVDIKRRFAAARAAARNDFKSCMSSAARRASRLGLSAGVAARYFSLLLRAVPAADASEEKRLNKNLASCWASLRRVENDIVLAAPAGAFGAVADDLGGWCFPASLPASAPAKCRKLWARRVRLLSDITTINALLARC